MKEINYPKWLYANKNGSRNKVRKIDQCRDEPTKFEKFCEKLYKVLEDH